MSIDLRQYRGCQRAHTTQRQTERTKPIPNQTQPIPEAAYRNLREWHRQTLSSDMPDHRLLLLGWPGGVVAELQEPSDGSAFSRLTLNRPHAEGPTTRDIDTETAFVLRVHLIVGGSLIVEAHGVPPGYYYTRVYIPGRTADGKRRRCYWSRLIVGTGGGYLTKETADFHDCRRCNAGQLRGQIDGGAAAKIGRVEARQYTLAAVREAIERGDRLPTGLTEDRVAELLEDGYRLLDKVPLGKAD